MALKLALTYIAGEISCRSALLQRQGDKVAREFLCFAALVRDYADETKHSRTKSLQLQYAGLLAIFTLEIDKLDEFIVVWDE